MGKEVKFLVLGVALAMLISTLYSVNLIPSAFAQEKTTQSGSIRLSPNHGPPGTTFTVYATGFSPGAHYKVYSPFSDMESVTASPVGMFTSEIIVPGDAKEGTYPVEILVKEIAVSREVMHSEIVLVTITQADFTVTGKNVPTTKSINKGSNPNPPPPPPPPPGGTTTNSANGGSSSDSPYITLNPTSGPPGTEVKISGENFIGDVSVSIGGTTLKENSVQNSITSIGGSIFGWITIPESAQPGPFPIQVDSSAPTANAIFTVTGKKIAPPSPPAPTATGHSTTNPPPPPPPQPPNGEKTGVGATAGTTSTSGAISGNPPNPPQPPQPPGGTGNEQGGTGMGAGSTPPASPSPNPAPPISYIPSKRPEGESQDSGTTFQVVKSVDGGDATPSDFSFTVTLTDSQGNSAKYSLSNNPNEDGNPSASFSKNLDLPQGTPLSEGNYQITEDDPKGYEVSYSNGCQGTFANDGYMYTCYITNYKPGDTSYDRQKNGYNPVPLPEPGVSNPTTSNTMTYSRSTQTAIPSWIKNNAKWWTEGAIDDKTFFQGMQYISGGSSSVSQSSSSSSSGSPQIPVWVKNTVKWWVNGQVSDDEFKNAVKYMLSTKIVTGQ